MSMICAYSLNGLYICIEASPHTALWKYKAKVALIDLSLIQTQVQPIELRNLRLKLDQFNYHQLIMLQN